MTFSQFKLLDSDDQYIVWLSKSIEVATFEEYGFLHILYELDNFYIEIKFLKTKPDVALFVAFRDDFRLTPYLKRIDLAEIYSCI